jgi:hypothetical protein
MSATRPGLVTWHVLPVNSMLGWLVLWVLVTLADWQHPTAQQLRMTCEASIQAMSNWARADSNHVGQQYTYHTLLMPVLVRLQGH